MKYVISLIDDPEEVEMLNETATTLFTKSMLTVQEYICGLENTKPLAEIMKISHAANTALANSINLFALMYAKPIVIELNDDNGMFDYGIVKAQIKKGVNAIGEQIATIKQTFITQLAEADATVSVEEIPKEYIETLYEAADEFSETIVDIYKQRYRKFLDILRDTGTFSATAVGPDSPFEGPVDITIFDGRK